MRGLAGGVRGRRIVTWVRLDDGMLDNPKVARLNPLGFAMHAAGLLYSARNLTDGIVPGGVVNRLLDWHGIGYTEKADPREEMIAAFAVTAYFVVNTQLLENGIWHDVEGSEGCASSACAEAPRPRRDEFLIHDFLVYQRSKAEVLAERAKTAERVRKHRNARGNGERNEGSNTVTNGGVTGPPVPVPVPDTETSIEVSARSVADRANDITKAYYDAEPMSNFPAIRTMVRKAMRKGYPDDVIQAALLRLADDGRGVTTETLRIEIEGMPERKSRQPDRAAEIMTKAMDRDV